MEKVINSINEIELLKRKNSLYENISKEMIESFQGFKKTWEELRAELENSLYESRTQNEKLKDLLKKEVHNNNTLRDYIFQLHMEIHRIKTALRMK